MITDKLYNARIYQGLDERIARGLAFLQKIAKSDPEIGVHEIDGKKLYAVVSEYTTKPVDNTQWEAHGKYIDIQYVCKGRERIGYANIHSLSNTKEYDADNDVARYSGEGDFITVDEGSFMILFPEDAHMPGRNAEKESGVVKIVVKVMTE